MRCGLEEKIAKSYPDGQKPDTKACMEDKLTFSSEVQKANATHAGRSGSDTIDFAHDSVSVYFAY